MSSLVEKAVAVFRRDVFTAARYRTGFLITTAGAAAEVTAFYFLARAIGPGFRPDGVEYFPFVLIGTGFYTFLVMAINSFLTSVQEAQQTGTLEVLVTSSTAPAVLVLLSALSAFAVNVFQLLLYGAGGLLLSNVTIANANVVGCMVILLLSLVIVAAIGLLAAAVQIAIQKGSAVVWVLGSGLWFLTGALFPVSTLPKPLQILSTSLPLTHLLIGLRLALLQGAGLLQLRSEIVILAAFSALLLPLALFVFSVTLRRARRQGTLSFY